MRKKAQRRFLLFAAVFSLLSIQLYFWVPQAPALDTPHNKNQQNTVIGCDDCHDPAKESADPEWWSNLNVCGRCHNSAFDANNAMDVTTHNKDGNVLAQCTDCHNPHKQMQFRTWKSSSYLDTGVTEMISSPTATTLTKRSSNLNWVENQWKGMVLIPNVKAPAYNYRIDSNTSDSITIESFDKTGEDDDDETTMKYAASGQTFAIVYGRLVKDQVAGKYVKFFRPEGDYSFADDSSTVNDICQVCHTQTRWFKRDGTLQGAGDDTHYYAAPEEKCVNCHPHTGGFMPTCTRCHGDPDHDTPPPIDTETLVHTNGSEDITTGSDTAGAHRKHATSDEMAYPCATCHGPNFQDKKHNQTALGPSVTMGFQEIARYLLGSSSMSSYDGQSDVTYNFSNDVTTVTNTGSMTCNTIYCHSTAQDPSGGPDTDLITYRKPTWDAIGQIDCGSCHNNMDTDDDPPGSHKKHAQIRDYPCATCHNGYEEDKTNKSTHANTQINLNFSDLAVRSGVSTTYNQVENENPAGNGYGQCTSPCHSPGQGENGEGMPDYPDDYANPTWGANGTVNCGSCHANMKTATSPPGSHKKHVQVRGYNCDQCHSGYKMGPPEPDTVNQNTHNNDKVNLDFSSGQAKNTIYGQGLEHDLGNGYDTCSNSACHSPGQADGGGPLGVITTVTPTWGRSVDCGSCHQKMNTATSPPGSHRIHTNAGERNYDCNICHGDGYSRENDGSVVQLTHNNTEINLNFTGLAIRSTSTYTYSQGLIHDLGNWYGECSNIYCHSNGKAEYKTPLWGSSNTVGCSFCHGFPPNTGAHLTHVMDSSLVSEVYGTTEVKSYGTNYAFGCGNCHPTDLSKHWDGNVDIILTPASGALKSKNDPLAAMDPNTKVCSKIYCHSDGSGNNIASASTPTWGQTFAGMGGDPCAKCHNNSPTGTSAHGAHIVGMHYNDVFSGSSGTVSVHGTAYSTTLNCNICHNETITVSNNDLNVNCVGCHSTNPKGTLTRIDLTNKSKHVSGQVDVIFVNEKFNSRAQLRGDIDSVDELRNNWDRVNGYKTSTSHDITDAPLSSGTFTQETKSCTVACHNGNYVTWTSTTVSCNSCHTALP